MAIIAATAAMLPFAHAAVGNIDDTAGVERVSVGPDGQLYAWNKEVKGSSLAFRILMNGF
jgi:hypothetical protein